MKTTVSTIGKFKIPSQTEIKILEFVFYEDEVCGFTINMEVPHSSTTRINNLESRGLLFVRVEVPRKREDLPRRIYSLTPKGREILNALRELEPFMQKVHLLYRKGSA